MTHPPFLGNFEEPWEQREPANQYLGKRRLVEECHIIYVYALQRAVGKKALIAAIREARPFRVPVPGGQYDVWLVYELHRFPGKRERWSSLEDGTARLWLWCPGCHCKIAKLYYFFFPGSFHRSELLCRKCHRLSYVSVNSGANRWYREVARPIKRFLREKERLLRKRYGPLVRDHPIHRAPYSASSCCFWLDELGLPPLPPIGLPLPVGETWQERKPQRASG